MAKQESSNNDIWLESEPKDDKPVEWKKKKKWESNLVIGKENSLLQDYSWNVHSSGSIT